MGVTTGAAAPTNSVMVLEPKFDTHTFPEPSIAGKAGVFMPPSPNPFAPEIAAPEELSSTTVLPAAFAAHTLPEPSMAMPKGSLMPLPV